MEKVKHLVYLSFGSNLGDRKQNLLTAIQFIDSEIGEVTTVSSIYESEAWGYNSENNYYNCCVALETTLSPRELLKETQRIELLLGRKQKGLYSDRPIDIDILIFDSLVVEEEELIIPHPKIAMRAFVILPLNEIAPDCFLSDKEGVVSKVASRFQEDKSIVKIGELKN